MSCSSDDFMTDTARNRRCLCSIITRNKPAEKENTERVVTETSQESISTSVETSCAMSTATQSEKDDVALIVALNRNFKTLRFLDVATLSGGKGKQEDEEDKILSLVRRRAEYKKDFIVTCKEFEDIVSPYSYAKSEVRSVILSLQVWRSLGHALPLIEDLASILFTGKKGKNVSVWQLEVARDILIHTVRYQEVDSKKNLPLNRFEKAFIEWHKSLFDSNLVRAIFAET